MIFLLIIGLTDWPNYRLLNQEIERDDLERQVYKCGAKTVLTKGTIIIEGDTFKRGRFRPLINPRETKTKPLWMKNQFVIQSSEMADKETGGVHGTMNPFIDTGDSGSMVFIKKNGQMIPVAMATGALFRGLCSKKIPIESYATPIFAVLEALRTINSQVSVYEFEKQNSKKKVFSSHERKEIGLKSSSAPTLCQRHETQLSVETLKQNSNKKVISTHEREKIRLKSASTPI